MVEKSRGIPGFSGPIVCGHLFTKKRHLSQHEAKRSQLEPACSASPGFREPVRQEHLNNVYRHHKHRHQHAVEAGRSISDRLIALEEQFHTWATQRLCVSAKGLWTNKMVLCHKMGDAGIHVCLFFSKVVSKWIGIHAFLPKFPFSTALEPVPKR